MNGATVSRLAREYVAAAEDEEALWNGACAAARADDLAVSARDTPAGRLCPSARAETDSAWAALVAACDSIDEAWIRAAAYRYRPESSRYTPSASLPRLLPGPTPGPVEALICTTNA